MSQSHATLGDRTDEMISAAVRGLIAQHRADPRRVALAAGVSRAALYRKLSNDSPWRAVEVDRLAHFFDVTRDSLYEGRADFHAGTPTLGSEGCAFESRRVHLLRRKSDRRRRSRSSVVPLRLVADAA